MLAMDMNTVRRERNIDLTPVRGNFSPFRILEGLTGNRSSMAVVEWWCHVACFHI